MPFKELRILEFHQYNIKSIIISSILLEFHQYKNSDKTPFIIYVDLECVIEKKKLMDVK